VASHPYISGPGNITQIVGLLRKNFPATVTAETVKKYGLASNNESYLINALQFIGVIDEGGKRTALGSKVFTTHNEDDFRKAFGGLVHTAYNGLFELRGDQAWTLSREDLIGYFRTSDKTSDIIGSRQAAVFRTFATLAGYADATVAPKNKGATKPKEKSARSPNTSKAKKESETFAPVTGKSPRVDMTAKRDMALTVRIEINLPADGTRDTYDNIFQSIKANLLNE
jgi:hypothetical protein